MRAAAYVRGGSWSTLDDGEGSTQNALQSQIMQNASVRNSEQGLQLEAFLSIEVLRSLLGPCAAEPAR